MATLIPNEEGSVDAFQDAWTDEATGMIIMDHDDDVEDDNYDDFDDHLWMYHGATLESATNDLPQAKLSSPTSSAPSSTGKSDAADLRPDDVHLTPHPRSNVVSPSPTDFRDDGVQFHDINVHEETEKQGLVGMDRTSPVSADLFSPVDATLATGGHHPLMVEIIGGVHKGKSAVFVRRTPQKIAVRLFEDGSDNGSSSKPRYLDPSNVRFSTGATPIDDTCDTSPYDPRKVRRDFVAASPSPTCVRAIPAPSLDSCENIVDIVGGVHEGKEAVLLGRTAKRVSVRLLEDDPTSKPRYLLPCNVRVRSADSESMHDHQEPSSDKWDDRPPSSARDQRYETRSQAKGLAFHLNTFLGFPIHYVLLNSPGERSPMAGTFAGHLFGNRLIEFRIKADATVGELPRTCQAENGCTYELLVTKLQKSSTSVGGGYARCRTDIRAVYVLVNGPGVQPLHLETELSKIAAFHLLAPLKAASRLELLCSSARKSTRQGQEFLMFDDLTSNDFEMIPEVANEGCGFCPSHFITRWLGNYAVGKRTFAVQVRLFAPRIGIGKGVLMVKPGIDKIQIPPSMLKVGPSHLDGQDTAVVLVTTNGVFPFPAHRHAACVLLGEKPPPKSFVPKRLSPMICTLFRSIGVPDDLVDNYAEEIHEERGKHLKHASVVGLADPTGNIPSGHVFLTGIPECCDFGHEVFVTRYPCTERSDGTLWPIVLAKPDTMSDSDWTFLQSLHFGGIIFGNPLPGQPPMPNMIADGDLDGDLYFVCWHQQILSHMNTLKGLPTTEAVDVETKESNVSNELVSYEWLRNAQDIMRSIKTLVEKHAIIGILFKQMEKAAQSSDPATSHFFSVAYKEAIDAGKHGGLVTLPRHLWCMVDERFHRCLRDAASS